MKAVPAVLLTLLMSACGLALPVREPVQEPAPPVVEPTQLVEPPKLEINGVAGELVTWCWKGGCADGFLHDPALAPAIAAPFEVQLPAGSRIESVSAIGPGAPGRQQSVEVPFDGSTIGEVPDGAIMLNVFIRFAEGGDGSYYWALNRPVESP
jgi:hypothetical protein